MSRYTRRILIELTNEDYAELEKAAATHRRTPQHQAGVFVEDGIRSHQAGVWHPADRPLVGVPASDHEFAVTACTPTATATMTSPDTEQAPAGP